MTRQLQRFVHACPARHFRQNGAAKHQNFDMARACCLNLPVSGASTTILGNDRVNSIARQHRLFGCLIERPARQNILRIRHSQRRLNRINAADNIVMLRRSLERQQLLAAKRKEDATRLVAQRLHRIHGCINHCPTVARDALPCGAAQSEKWNVSLTRRLSNIGRDACGVGVSGVDDQTDIVLANVSGQTLRTAKTAGAHWHALFHRIYGATSQRKRDGKSIMLREFTGKLPRFGGTTKNENRFLHVR